MYQNGRIHKFMWIQIPGRNKYKQSIHEPIAKIELHFSFSFNLKQIDTGL